jgi:hypothetical protein
LPLPRWLPSHWDVLPALLIVVLRELSLLRLGFEGTCYCSCLGLANDILSEWEDPWIPSRNHFARRYHPVPLHRIRFR